MTVLWLDRVGEVGHDRIRAVGGEGRCVVAAVDAEHEAESAVLAGGDARDGVLDDDRAFRCDAEQLGRPEERVGCRLAGESLSGRGDPIDHDAEPVAEPGRLEHAASVLRRRHHGLWDAGRIEEVHHRHRSRIRGDPLGIQHLVEDDVLAVPHRADRVAPRRVGRQPVGQLDAA